MKVEELSQFYGNLQKEKVYLYYQGPLWQELLEELNELVKKKIEMQGNLKNYSRFQILFIELVQNIVRYSSTITEEYNGTTISHGVIIAGAQGDVNFILAGNTVDSYHKNVLTQSLESLRGKNKEELTAMFKKQLRGKVHERGVGAGLGLIDIFRRADRVEYFFNETEQGKDFFSIKAEFSEN